MKNSKKQIIRHHYVIYALMAFLASLPVPSNASVPTPILAGPVVGATANTVNTGAAQNQPAVAVLPLTPAPKTVATQAKPNTSLAAVAVADDTRLVANNLNVATGSSAITTTTALDNSRVGANQFPPVRVQMDAFLLGNGANGQPQALPIDANTPLKMGNVVLYRTTYTNQSPDRIRQMTATVTIPEGMRLLGKVQPEIAWASADHKVFSTMPLKFREEGVLKELPYEYYKALRWQLKNIDLNGSVSVGYVAIVK